MRKKRLLCRFIVSITLSVLLLFSSWSPITMKKDAQAGSTIYSKNGNLITDVYGTTTYNGKSVRYRVITVMPGASSSLRNSYSYSYSGSNKLASATMLKFVGRNHYDNRNPLGDDDWSTVGFSAGDLSIYDTFRDANGIPAGFSKSTKVSNVLASVSVNELVMLTSVYIYDPAVYKWKLAYIGNYIAVEWNLSATAVINGQYVTTTKKGNAYTPSLSYNLNTLCKNTVGAANPRAPLYTIVDQAVEEYFIYNLTGTNPYHRYVSSGEAKNYARPFN